MTFRSYRASEQKIREIWDQSHLSQAELDENNNFKPIDIEKVIKHSRKSITKIPIVVLGSNTWYGSVPLENFTEEMVDYVFPLAVFKFLDTNTKKEELIEVFEGSLYFWFNKIESNKFVFRFAIDGDVDTNEGWGLDFSLILFNKRIYDNIQKTKR